ncbi:MAG: cysteine peptidase family C39 domain-containing protein, partial [Burkholderiaceae bacterium]
MTTVREVAAEPLPTTPRTGLPALCALARFHQVAADPQTLAHQLGLSAHQAGKPADLLLAAKHLGLKAKWVRVSADRLAHTPLPALAWLGDEASGHAVVLAQSDGHKVLVQDFEASAAAVSGAASRPQVLEVAALQQQGWSGQLMLVTSRASLTGELAKFDFSWFIPALVKYRKLLGEVLLISFMLQLFGLVSPLFFQVV